MTTIPADPCPCGRPLAYAACCGRYHAGAPAPDAEALMRSRYSAYVKQLPDYLLASWPAGTAAPARPNCRWTSRPASAPDGWG